MRFDDFAPLFSCTIAPRIVLIAASLCATSVPGATDPNQVLVENGKKLVAEAKCDACHASRLGGDGTVMYSRKERRVTDNAKLLSQVTRCSNELNLGLFPEDEAAIAAYLNATHYKFKD